MFFGNRHNEFPKTLRKHKERQRQIKNEMKTRKLTVTGFTNRGCIVVQARGFACVDRFQNSSYVILHHVMDCLVGRHLIKKLSWWPRLGMETQQLIQNAEIRGVIRSCKALLRGHGRPGCSANSLRLRIVGSDVFVPWGK